MRPGCCEMTRVFLNVFSQRIFLSQGTPTQQRDLCHRPSVKPHDGEPENSLFAKAPRSNSKSAGGGVDVVTLNSLKRPEIKVFLRWIDGERRATRAKRRARHRLKSAIGGVDAICGDGAVARILYVQEVFCDGEKGRSVSGQKRRAWHASQGAVLAINGECRDPIRTAEGDVNETAGVQNAVGLGVETNTGWTRYDKRRTWNRSQRAGGINGESQDAAGNIVVGGIEEFA